MRRAAQGSAAEKASASPPTDTARRRLFGGRPRGRGRDFRGSEMTRGTVAKLLGVDVSTVRRLEVSGELHPRLGPGGIRYFDQHEVLALRARRLRAPSKAVEMKVMAFEMFQRGVDWRDVAIRLRQDPYRIYRLWRLFTIDEKTLRDRSRS